ncbi:protein FAM126B isoform X2 [Folsomia candida]|uniref:protein FAM126B isoform X2 n=1 Tax=Folsomia candida TaxID=158441 RepID=UPI000B8FD850|nr:protein FAM126B isoform X2 [Folsomia candida]
MTDQLVVELLTEWAKLSDNLLSGCDGLNDFSESILNNEDLFQAVTHVLEENDRFRSLYGDVIAVLFSLYRAPHGKLRVFSGQFIPSLIYVYLNQIHSQKKCVALETLLRGIFELELSFEEIIPASARIANVNLPSIYHDPGGVSTSWLSDNDLDRLNLKTVKTITRQALVLNDERIRAPQRLPLCVELWWIFNHRLPHMPKHSIPMHLKVITKLITQGFTPMNSQKLQPPVRIVLSSKLLIEMVQTAYFSAYNGSPTLAEQILDEISARANYQLWADALLACHAVQDYLKSSGTRERGQIYRHPFHSEKIFPKLLDINFEPDCLPCYRHQFSLFDMIQSKHHHPTSCYLSVVSRTAASYSNYSTGSLSSIFLACIPFNSNVFI